MADPGINILTYHSISDAPGPTSIPLEVFKGQMDTLADSGYRVISLMEFAAWHQGEGDLDPRSAVITFDDGFADFAEAAAPVLKARGWSATVFLPSGRLGGNEDWDGPDGLGRRLMTWSQVSDLAAAGFEFGSHSVNHADLTTLAPDQLREELAASCEDIADRLRRAPDCFAPPYGRSDARVREEVKKYYRLSVGTTLQRATRRSDLFDLPRIEMHYFRDLRRWRAHLEGRGEGYFALRRGLRRLRSVLERFLVT